MLLLDSLAGLLAPHQCVGCAADGVIACRHCLLAMPVSVSRCYRCQRPAAQPATCPDCHRLSPLRAVYAATAYEQTAKQLLYALKFGRTRAAAAAIAWRMARTLPRLPEQTVIVPVPTVNRRVRQRGYDQAVLIARAYARLVGRPCIPLLQRLGDGEQKGAGRTQRQTQLADVYIVRQSISKHAAGRPIILIDDVITTGATLEAAARSLATAGLGPVHGLVFAQVW